MSMYIYALAVKACARMVRDQGDINIGLHNVVLSPLMWKGVHVSTTLQSVGYTFSYSMGRYYIS